MKIFIIQPDMAYMLCSGEVDAFDFGVDYGDQAVVAVVSSPEDGVECVKIGSNDEWRVEVNCCATLGIVPLPENLKRGIYVGMLFIRRSPKHCGSFWTCNSESPETCYQILEACFFDYQRPCTQELNKLDVHTVHRPLKPAIAGLDTLVISLSDYHFANVAYPNNFITIPLGNALRRVLFHNGRQLHYKTLKIVNGNGIKVFKFSKNNGIVTVPDYDGEPKKIYCPSRKAAIVSPFFRIHFEEQL